MSELLFGPGLLFRNAVLGGILVALVCSLLGVYVVLRRMVLLGVALPQASAAGIAAAFWLTGHAHQAGAGHAWPMIGSMLATFAALGLVMAYRGAGAPVEWAVGALFAIASAATVLFVALNPSGDLEVTNLLRGELLAISDSDLEVLAVASFVALLLFFAFRREILVASFDPEFARTTGRRPARADALLFFLLGGAISIGVMEAGPLVVFGFLVLPALAALRVAPGLGWALVISAALAVTCSLLGFELAYRVDLPTGPTSVALAAGAWVLALGGALLAPHLRRIQAGRAGGVVLVVLLLAGSPPACRFPFGGEPAPPSPLAPGSLPDLSGTAPVSVARFRNATGEELRIPSSNPLRDLEWAVGYARDPDWTVADALQARAFWELQRRGVAVRSFEESRSDLPAVPTGPRAAVEMARAAGLDGPILVGTLHRFTLTGTGLLLVRLDLSLVDAGDGELLWTGRAQHPVSVRSAVTVDEVLIDAAPAIFAEAFGNR